MRIATGFIVVVLLAIGISAGTAIANEEIYRWVDENGVVHFGNRAQAGPNAELVKVQKSPPPVIESQEAESQVQAAEPAADQPSYAQQRREERARLKQEAAIKREELAKECDFHRQVIARLEPMPRVIVEKSDGTVERMDDQERLDRLRESQEFVAKNCH
jgi:hypothetical protein